MHALAIIDMQRWMFRLPERAAQLPSLVPVINKLAADFEASGLPVFNVHVVHRADRSTWSRLMLKYDYPCMIEGTATSSLSTVSNCRHPRARSQSGPTVHFWERISKSNCVPSKSEAWFWPALSSMVVSACQRQPEIP
jgi:nicotinamidase-related amidase